MIIKKIFWIIVMVVTQSCATHTYNLEHGIESFKVQDYRQAFIRLLPEAKAGQADAQYAVGYMYYYGQGVIENRKKARYWIERSAAAGNESAIAALDSLRQGKNLSNVP